jgi:hypothetical protein
MHDGDMAGGNHRGSHRDVHTVGGGLVPLVVAQGLQSELRDDGAGQFSRAVSGVPHGSSCVGERCTPGDATRYPARQPRPPPTCGPADRLRPPAPSRWPRTHLTFAPTRTR